MIPPCSSLDQDAMDSSLELSADVVQGPRRQLGPQPNHQTGGVHQPGAVDVTVEGEPVAPAAAVTPPASADQNDQCPGDDTGVGDDVVAQGDVHLNSDPNQLDPVWRLRYSAGVTIYGATITALTLPRNLRAVHTTYERARLIASVGVPIGVAAVSLVVSFWLPSDPVRRSNWIRRLSWLNTFMLGGHIFYWVFPW